METLRELSLTEYLEISGGAPSTETSIFYDIGWFVGRSIREVESWFE